MAVLIDGDKRGEGAGPTKKAAQQKAAYEAVLQYQNGTAHSMSMPKEGRECI